MRQAFLHGALVMACMTAGLFFVRFWSQTRDRLFGMFGLAFWVLGVHWFFLAFVHPDSELFRPFFYFVRLVAFMLILLAIIDKNRRRG